MRIFTGDDIETIINNQDKSILKLVWYFYLSKLVNYFQSFPDWIFRWYWPPYSGDVDPPQGLWFKELKWL